MYPTEKLSIKAWAEEDRPREKLLLKGRHTLTDAELIAILIGSGNASESAVELSKRILHGSENNLHALARLSVSDLMKFKGIGEAKAISIIAALELGRRRSTAEGTEPAAVRFSKEAFQLIYPDLADLPQEKFFVILLNRNQKLIKKHELSSGGIAATIVDPKLVFKVAIEYLAASIILCHNHPSGSLQPSQADKNLTQQLKQAGALLDITVADHLIIGGTGYFSFADEGLL